MFDESEWKPLVDKLVRLTRESKLNWRIEGSAYAVLVDGIDFVAGSVDADGRPPYFLSLWGIGDEGNEIQLERLESEPLPDVDPDWISIDDLTAAQRLPTLHSLAERSAQGTPQLFNSVMSKLDALDPDAAPF